MMPPPLSETPFLTPTTVTHRSSRRPLLSFITATRYLRRVSSRGLMRDQTGWAYSWPAIILDLVCNITLIVASMCVMITSVDEDHAVRLRVWIVGYAIQCCVHVVFVCVECKRKWDRVGVLNGENSEAARDENSGSPRDEEYIVVDLDHVNVVQDHSYEEETRGVAKHLESANIVFSFIWWINGFYWIYIGGQNLTQDSPQLYWLCITFLVFDVYFVVICVAGECVVGLADCFCLPCIHSILYDVTDQEGGFESFLERLPRYKFQKIGENQNVNTQNEEIQEPPIGKMTECNTDTPSEHVLPLEDAVCCICLCAYENGNVLRRLPCCHHFHSTCISRWLYLEATCPLCKKIIQVW